MKALTVDVIEQYPDDYPIVRFLNKEGLLRTLGVESDIPRQRTDLNPTLLFRSLNYYRRIEDHRGDRYENQIITRHPETGALLSNQNLNTVLVSCWSCYQQEDLYTALPWDIFKGSVAVIESTIGEVKKMINWIAPTPKDVDHAPNAGSLRADFTEHGKVIYYTPETDHEALYGKYQIQSKNCFFKRQVPYSAEKEYRFMIMFAAHLHFSPEMFCVRLKDTSYITKIHLKNDVFSKVELQAFHAYYHNRINML
ncbi:hypothetical protein OQJ18_12715 [Fluoribacter dumoffii]|uniref:hypothetical protein n=1 Tax=Fluoribacter dumoffii TaxID=463 RepID=UPI00026C8275|nr:hypothetical protein [Fluoribacter dumoffii]MCW8387450.1 hypothetical protein [Fluoribacter dumoffii]MCW8417042.1 hypothetical protein [Fluoribacter dumoffii]MCW8455118.1 hypothetical protein [Fluoribacter dumoffii]MCW8460805.1 hypothetical protein [Fluoribacter dumoffii]MCW8484247.1 hypothetical protein [Fluoribacter dumoffii]